MRFSTKTLLVLGFTLLGILLFAQKTDSLQTKAVAFVTDKFPSTRVLNVEVSSVSPYKFSHELENVDLPDNKIRDFKQVKANANFYFLKKKNWTITTSLNYKFTHFEVDQPQQFSPNVNDKNDFHYHSEAVTATHISKLWNKMAIYTASVSVDGNENHFERIRGLLTGSIMLKVTAQIKLLLGVAVIVDPSAQIPAIPIITYEHKFKNGWIADVILPKRLMMKKDVFENGRFSFGSEMDMTSFYLNQENRTYEYRQTEINTGIVYEHKFGDFIGTFKSGLRTIPTARVFDMKDNFNDYFYKATPKSSYYINFGISYNPFMKSKK